LGVDGQGQRFDRAVRLALEVGMALGAWRKIPKALS